MKKVFYFFSRCTACISTLNASVCFDLEARLRLIWLSFSTVRACKFYCLNCPIIKADEFKLLRIILVPGPFEAWIVEIIKIASSQSELITRSLNNSVCILLVINYFHPHVRIKFIIWDLYVIRINSSKEEFV